MYMLKINLGETIRRDLIKISPCSLLRLLKETDKLFLPLESLKMLKEEHGEYHWDRSAIKNWKKDTTWKKAIKSISVNVVSENITALVALFKLAVC